MAALFRKKQPFQFAVDDLFAHANQLVGIKGEILRILVRAEVLGLFRRQIVPLLAGDLASSATHAQRRVDEK